MNKAELKQKYEIEEFSISECAKLFSISPKTLRKKLVEYEIRVRGQNEYTNRRRLLLKNNKNLGSKTKSYYDNIKETGEIPENELKRREKIGKWSSEFERTEEHVQKISDALIGNTNGIGHEVSEETRRKISENSSKAIKEKIAEEGYTWGHTGYKHSEETKNKLRDGQIKKLQEKFYLGKMTKLEKKGYAKLDKAGIEYEPQKQIDYYLVDAYIPETNTIIEFQGQYWHTREDIKQKDKGKRTFFKNKGYNLVEVWEDKMDSWNPLEM